MSGSKISEKSKDFCPLATSSRRDNRKVTQFFLYTSSFLDFLLWDTNKHKNRGEVLIPFKER